MDADAVRRAVKHLCNVRIVFLGHRCTVRNFEQLPVGIGHAADPLRDIVAQPRFPAAGAQRLDKRADRHHEPLRQQQIHPGRAEHLDHGRGAQLI